MKPEDAFKDACESIVKNIKSWDDLYEFFDTLAGRVRDEPSPMTMMNAFFAMYAFILAMRDLPDEGDAAVLMTEMLSNMILKPKEAMGFDLVSMTPEEIEALALQHLKEAIMIAASAPQAEESTSGTTTQQKRMLH